jgi:hypothetical protein
MLIEDDAQDANVEVRFSDTEKAPQASQVTDARVAVLCQ